MQNFRRLPPLLRLAKVLGYLCALTAAAIFAWMLVTRPSINVLPQDIAMGWSLIALRTAFDKSASLYNVRLRRRAPNAWPRQARLIVLLGALPICAVTLILLVPFSSSDAWIRTELLYAGVLVGNLTFMGILFWEPIPRERRIGAHFDDFLRRYWRAHTRPLD